MDEAPEINRGKKLKRLYPKEETVVEAPFSSDSMNIGEKLFAMGFKETPFGAGSEGMRKELLLKIIMDYLVGPVSKLYDKLYDEALIDSDFGYGVSCGMNFAYSLMSGTSREPELVRDAFFKELNAIKSSGMDGRELDSIKRMLLGESIRLSDDDESFLRTIVTFHNKEQDWFEMAQVLDSIKLEEANRALTEMLKKESFTLAVTLPLENK
jgi:predicted Zn-dependent peptidase